MKAQIIPLLPIEVIILIIQALAQPIYATNHSNFDQNKRKNHSIKRKLNNLSLVSKSFRFDAQKALYYSIFIGNYQRLESFNQLANPRLYSYVIKLKIDLDISLFHTAQDFRLLSGYSNASQPTPHPTSQSRPFDNISSQTVVKRLDSFFELLANVQETLLSLSISTKDSLAAISPIALAGTFPGIPLKLTFLECDASLLWTYSFSHSVGSTLSRLSIVGSIVEGINSVAFKNLKTFFERAGKNLKSLNVSYMKWDDIEPFMEDMPILEELLLHHISNSERPTSIRFPPSLVRLGVTSDHNLVEALGAKDVDPNSTVVPNFNHSIQHLVIQSLERMETLLLLPPLESITIHLCPFDFLFALEMLEIGQVSFKLRLWKGLLEAAGVRERCQELGIMVERMRE